MRADFISAKKTLRTSRSGLSVEAVNGCCYGKDSKPDKGDYRKLCGQRFWEFISGNENLFVEIIEPLAHRAKENNEKFVKEYQCLLNRVTGDFIKEFCLEDGRIDWEKIVKLNSGKVTPPRIRPAKNASTASKETKIKKKKSSN